MKIRLTTVLFCLLTALAVSGAVFFIRYAKFSISGASVLEIRDDDSGKLYGSWALEKNGEFAIEFIHSVNQGPVRETFRVDGGLLKPLSVRFTSFGAGMQSDLLEGMSFDQDGDYMILTGFDSSFDELSYIVGTVSDHLLFINGETISLRDLCGRNAHITFKVR